MNVNENRLKELIERASISCESCPLYREVNDYSMCDEYNEHTNPDTIPADCSKGILKWLQEFDTAEALEAGAHIVNDIVIFPPEEIPFEPFYGTPCEAATPKGKHGPYCNGKDCDYVDCCPYDW